MQAIPSPVSAARAAPRRFATYEDGISKALPGDVLYGEAISLSAHQYAEHFGCTLRHVYPAYLCMISGQRLLAACGMRSGDQPLFLEQYLDQPVCRLLADIKGQPFAPGQLVELGSFAVRKRVFALPFMAALAPALRRAGFTYGVATATLPVRRCLRRLGIETFHLGAAQASRLADGGREWGSYYTQRPAIIAGSIVDVDARLRAVARA